MSNTAMAALKIAAIFFALTLLALYVAYRQGTGPFAKEPASVAGEPVFPVTPASPTMFSTSKSGTLLVDPVPAGFDPEKALTAESIDQLIGEAEGKGKKDPGSSGSIPILMPGSKSINMPIFHINPGDRNLSENSPIGDPFQASDTIEEERNGEPVIIGGSSKGLVPVIPSTKAGPIFFDSDQPGSTE